MLRVVKPFFSEAEGVPQFKLPHLTLAASTLSDFEKAVFIRKFLVAETLNPMLSDKNSKRLMVSLSEVMDCEWSVPADAIMNENLATAVNELKRSLRAMKHAVEKSFKSTTKTRVYEDAVLLMGANAHDKSVLGTIGTETQCVQDWKLLLSDMAAKAPEMLANAPALRNACELAEAIETANPSCEQANNIKTVLESLPRLQASCGGGAADDLEKQTTSATITSATNLVKEYEDMEDADASALSAFQHKVKAFFQKPISIEA